MFVVVQHSQSTAEQWKYSLSHLMTKFQCGIKFHKLLKQWLILIEIFETQAYNANILSIATKIMLDYELIKLAPVYDIPAIDENLDLSLFLYFEHIYHLPIISTRKPFGFFSCPRGGDKRGQTHIIEA